MTRVSIITPTVRPAGLVTNARGLLNQSLPIDEWIIVTPQVKMAQTFIGKFDLPIRIMSEPEKKEGDVYTLNKALNEAVRTTAGDVIVEIQDYIWIPPDAIERLVALYEKMGDAWQITGVGDQYKGIDKYGRPTGAVWTDPRKKYPHKTGETYPEAIEENFCLYTRKALYDVGGWDEELDKGFAMNNTSVVERMADLGYRFYLDQSLEIRGLQHGRLDDWDKNHAMNGLYIERKQQLVENGVWPRLPYLTK